MGKGVEGVHPNRVAEGQRVPAAGDLERQRVIPGGQPAQRVEDGLRRGCRRIGIDLGAQAAVEDDAGDPR